MSILPTAGSKEQHKGKAMKSLINFQHWPLRLKIVLLLFVSSALPLAIFGGIESHHAREDVLKNTAALLTARGDEVEGKLDAFNHLYLRSAERVARLPDVVRYVRAPTASREKMAPVVRDVFDIWMKTDANVRGYSLLDSTGTVVLSTEASLAGRNLSAYHYVQQALQGIPVISDLHISDAETGSVPTIAYLVPTKDQSGQIAGVIVAWVRASAFWSIIAEGNEKAGAKSFSVLFDHSGVRIGHSYNKDIVFHPGGQLDPATIDGMVAEHRFGERTRQLLEDPRTFPEQFDLARTPSAAREVFRGFAPVNQQWNIGVARRLTTVPWTLFYMIPENSLDASIIELVTRIALFAAGVILFAVAAGAFVSRGIVSSVKLVSEGADTLSASASELTASVVQIVSSTTETATAVSETTATVEEVKQTVQLANQKAKQVSDGAQQTAQVAQSGRQAVEEMIGGMNRIREQTASTAESIVKLSEQSQVIGEIIATVNDLAEQSNLLAVNAAIEAAKAGDQGKGFAVVAQEIKSLAQQSKQATAQVRAILGDIQKATGAAVMATDLNGKAVEAGVQQSDAAGEAIRMLEESIVEAAQAALQIVASSQQQLVGMNQVALAMDNIKQANTQNMAGIRQAEAAAQNLHELGIKLKQLVEKN
jgi:hypothetical protein